MTLDKKIATLLLCSVAPNVLVGQTVELRSPDGFISVAGEIAGFNGAMVAIQTSVGLMSVPAAEVVCYGLACADIIAANDFGLTAAAFAGVMDGGDTPGAVVADDLVLGFADTDYGDLYRILAAVVTQSDQAQIMARLNDDGALDLQNAQGTQTARLRIAEPDEQADITLSAVALSGPADQAYASPRDWALATDPTHQMLGLRALAVVTGANVGMDALTRDQLASIYAGEITNWSQIGGADQPVIPLQLPADSDLRRDVTDIVMAPAGKTIADTVLTLGDEAAVVTTMADIAGSISLVSPANVGSARVLSVAAACGLAVGPDDFSVASGDYPLIWPVMATFAATPQTGLVPAMFDFAATPAAQAHFADAGFVAAPGPQAEADKAARLGQLLAPGLDPVERPAAAQMLQTLFEAERLAPTLKGGAVSGPEAGWNRAMLHQLAGLLQQPAYAGREVIFAGFATSNAGPQDAIDQSAIAAVDILAAFDAFAPQVAADSGLTLSAAGFGAVAPAGCYDGQLDSPVHSRVEVWVK